MCMYLTALSCVLFVWQVVVTVPNWPADEKRFCCMLVATVAISRMQGCRNVEEFQCLNCIEEGTYSVVYRAVDRKTGMSICLSVCQNLKCLA